MKNKIKKKSPEISVLMTVYNSEDWLEQSICSVLSQTFSDFEFIIVDDGSTDKSFEILIGYEKTDPRIKVYKKKNSGLTDSLNYGLQMVNGNWLARIDSDDVCKSNRLENQLSFAKQNNTFILIGSGLQIINEKNDKGKIYIYPKSSKKLVSQISKGDAFFPHSSAFINVNALRKVGGYRSQFKRSQDQDLWLRLSEIGTISCIDEPLVFIRKHSSQMSVIDSGLMQIQYSYLAMTSYHIRQMGETDPLTEINKNKFKEFFNFINNYLITREIFQIRSLIEELKITIYYEKSLSMKLFKIIKLIFKKPKKLLLAIFYTILRQNLASKIATNWIIKKN